MVENRKVTGQPFYGAWILPLLTSLHVTKEGCIWILLANIFLRFAGLYEEPVAVVLALLVSGTMSYALLQYLPKLARVFNCIPILIPIGVFLYQMDKASEAIMLFPPLVLMIMYVWKRYQVDYFEVTDHFTRSTVLLTIGGVCGLAMGCVWAMPMALICLVVSVFSQRILRQIKDHILTATSLLLELALMTGLCLLCLLLSSRGARAMISSTYLMIVEYIFTPVISLLCKGLVILAHWIYLLMQRMGYQPREADEFVMQMMESTESEAMELSQGEPDQGNFVWVVFAAIFIFFAIRWLIKKSRLKSGGEYDGRGVQAMSQRSYVEGARMTGSGFVFRDRSARGKVRRSYAKFLKDIRRGGYEAYPQDTSLDIQKKLNGSKTIDKAQQLREIYLKARYDSEAHISDKEAAMASALEKEIKDLLK